MCLKNADSGNKIHTYIHTYIFKQHLSGTYSSNVKAPIILLQHTLSMDKFWHQNFYYASRRSIGKFH